MADFETQQRFPWRIFLRLVFIQAVLILMALGLSGVFGRHYFKKQFISQVENQLLNTLTSLSHYLPTAKVTEWCANSVAQTEMRLTLIAQDGAVACDSHHSTESMENHAQRPEIVAARESGTGRSIRFSSTMQESMIYVAIRVSNSGQILRGAIPLARLNQTLRAFDTSLILFLVVTALALALFAIWSGRQLVSPLGRLLTKIQTISSEESKDKNLWSDDPGEESYGEWSDLESSLENIQNQLQEKVESLVVERELQATLMAALSDAILAIDMEGAPLFFNSRFALLVGNVEFTRKKRLWEMFRDPEMLDAFQAALKEGKSTTLPVLPVTSVNGKRFFSVAVSPLKKRGGEMFGAMGIFHDVTELKSAEQIRIDFVANVSHELRTPLTAIKGYSDTLQQDVKDGRTIDPKFIEVISRHSDRLLQLINDLLDLSSLESTDLLQKNRVGTEVSTLRVVQHMKTALEKKKQSIKTDFKATTVLADPTRLEQVLVNLLDNANKYTPAGGELSVTWEMGPERESILRVRDTGPGIPEEHHARLFERFYRVDKARSREQGGTGLGLAIVKHIMQRHGGSVRVESEVGRGTEFICTFPDVEESLNNS